MAKYVIEEKERSASGIYYSIKVKSTDPWPEVWVNYDLETKKAYCCSCSGPLAAMLSSCRHAKAVKRYADKLNRQTPAK